jgi:hypothetical protein
MKNLLIGFLILGSMSSHADTMSEGRKEVAVLEILQSNQYSKVKDFEIERLELVFNTTNLMLLWPVAGQVFAAFRYADEGDQDYDTISVDLSKNGRDYYLECTVFSEKKDRINRELEHVAIDYKVSLSNCYFENIHTGISKGYIWMGDKEWSEYSNY